MLQVDDLIEPGAEQILLTRLTPFPWLHLVPRQSMQRRVNHKSNLQGIPFRRPDSRKIRLPKRTDSRFQINDLGILHGRLILMTLTQIKRQRSLGISLLPGPEFLGLNAWNVDYQSFGPKTLIETTPDRKLNFIKTRN